MSLKQYHKKRDFTKTSEPKGNVTKDAHHLFIIQKHAASHLHYDFRIELDGTLKSWAVPKGPSLNPHDKRLAIHVEDHPIEYGNFEGIIPKGQYGGGTVMLWDKGTWEPLDENPVKAYKEGHLRFNLHAQKLNGRWDLIRFQDEKHWFLIKYQDEYARFQRDFDITKALDTSVLTQQTMDQIAQNYEHIWSLKDISVPEGLSKSDYPDFIPPQLATLVNQAPEGDRWLHEIKFDGYRILSYKKGDKVTLKSRTNNDWTNDFPSVAQALKTLSIKNLVLDGEMVVLDKQGKSDFQLLQNAIANKEDGACVYFLFDILYFDQYDLRELPLVERKSILKSIIRGVSPLLIYSDHIIDDGPKVFENSCRLALEGIISKQVNSTYSSSRNKDWLKIKCVKRQEFVIGGYTPPRGQRSHFGSLLLGVFNKKGQLEYVGNVGTGFTNETLDEIHQLLLKNKAKTNPFNTEPTGYSHVSWTHPKLVAEVEFTEWTHDGRLRHSSFKGLRLDKKASEVMREEVSMTEEKTAHSHTTDVVISNPTKILYPEDHITKQDVFLYYEAISDYILPFIASRPLTLVRCPSNYKDSFYQRHYNKKMPKALHPIEIKHGDKTDSYLYLNDKEGLLSLVQMDVLEIHPWGSTIEHLEQPDMMVIDLDPGPDVPWSKVVASALEIRHHLIQYKLKSFVKTTGGKGLHVVVPIVPEYSWDEVKAFTHVFVQFLEKLKPEAYISTMTKSKRNGKIFVDYLRNQRTATAIGAYSTRSRIHAPVSTPLAWDELSDKIEDNTYTIKTLPQRLKILTKDPWKDFWEVKQSLRLDELK